MGGVLTNTFPLGMIFDGTVGIAGGRRTTPPSPSTSMVSITPGGVPGGSLPPPDEASASFLPKNSISVPFSDGGAVSFPPL